jgi:hypothetical protein
VAGLAVNTISDAYPGAAPTAVGLAVFFVAAVPSSCAAAGMPRVLPTPV